MELLLLWAERGLNLRYSTHLQRNNSLLQEAGERLTPHTFNPVQYMVTQVCLPDLKQCLKWAESPSTCGILSTEGGLPNRI